MREREREMSQHAASPTQNGRTRKGKTKKDRLDKELARREETINKKEREL